MYYEILFLMFPLFQCHRNQRKLPSVQYEATNHGYTASKFPCKARIWVIYVNTAEYSSPLKQKLHDAHLSGSILVNIAISKVKIDWKYLGDLAKPSVELILAYVGVICPRFTLKLSFFSVQTSYFRLSPHLVAMHSNNCLPWEELFVYSWCQYNLN